MSLAIGHNDSGAETVARLVPGARVVKAFNTTGANNMADSYYRGGKLAQKMGRNFGFAMLRRRTV